MNTTALPIDKPSFKTFLWRVTALQFITYFLVGFLSYTIFSYNTLYKTGVYQYYMKPTSSVWVAAGPALQVIRGILFSIVLWPFRDIILFSRWGWLKLWILFIGLAILGATGAAPGSLEGVIYTKLSPTEHFIGSPEVLLQTFLFSFLLFYWYKKPTFAINIISIILVSIILVLSLLGILVVSQGSVAH